MKLNEILDMGGDAQQPQAQAPMAQPSAPAARPAVKPRRKSKAVAGDMDTTIAGMPCQIVVTTSNSVKGSYSHDAPSDWDYYGYDEFEFDVYDRKGYPAPWLEKKMTDKDYARIKDEWFSQQGDRDDYDGPDDYDDRY